MANNNCRGHRSWNCYYLVQQYDAVSLLTLIGIIMSAIWECKVGIIGNVDLPNGADLPMRIAIEKAFKDVAGVECEFNFSGWGGSLNKFELAVIKNDDNLIFNEGLK
jgi:hypothetical protein